MAQGLAGEDGLALQRLQLVDRTESVLGHASGTAESVEGPGRLIIHEK